MKRFPSRRPAAALAICAIAAVMSGCSASFSTGGTTTIDKPDVVSDVQKFMSQQLVDLPPTKSLDCPGDVEAKVGTTFECQATLTNGQTVTIPLRVSSVNGSQGHMTSNPKVVDQALAVDLLYKAAQSPLKSVDCPTGLPAKVGKTFDCKAAFTNGSASTVTLRVAAAPPSGIQNLTIVGARRS